MDGGRRENVIFSFGSTIFTVDSEDAKPNEIQSSLFFFRHFLSFGSSVSETAVIYEYN